MTETHTTSEQETARQAATALAATCQYDGTHIQQVCRLALNLFDQLQELHGLSDQERFWLDLAATLHDIGWVDGQKGHHKASLQIILTTPMLPLDNHERLIVGSIARYHRKALPKQSHDHFAALKPDEQDIVRKLAALLRLADGLDASHQGLINAITCRIGKKKVHIHCESYQKGKDERVYAVEKGDLFEQVYGKSPAIEWEKIRA